VSYEGNLSGMSNTLLGDPFRDTGTAEAVCGCYERNISGMSKTLLADTFRRI
jgi:hypothetical protein